MKVEVDENGKVSNPKMNTKVINKEFFTHIMDIQLVSTSIKNYRCDIACKQKNRNSIVIYQAANTECHPDESESELGGTDLDHDKSHMT